MKYQVNIKELLETIVEIEAETETEAIEIATKKYDDLEIVLDSENLTDVEFGILK